LPESHDITAKLFANDVKVYFKICRLEDGVLLQQALDFIATWASEWQLSISINKCNLLNIGRSWCELIYYINSIQLPHCETCCDLGVVIASDLSPSHRIPEIVQSHSPCFISGDKKLLVKAFTVYVRPILEYNSTI